MIETRACECGQKGYVTATRPMKAGHVWRRYHCACGKRWSSLEIRVIEE